jgi:hypothetical protein
MPNVPTPKALRLLTVWLALTGCCFLLGVHPAEALPPCMSCPCKMSFGWWSWSYNPPQGMMQQSGTQWNPLATNQGGAPILAGACPDPPNRYQSVWDQGAIFQFPPGQALTCDAGANYGSLQETTLVGQGTKLTGNMYYWYCAN